jgi:hypothetical protein
MRLRSIAIVVVLDLFLVAAIVLAVVGLGSSDKKSPVKSSAVKVPHAAQATHPAHQFLYSLDAHNGTLVSSGKKGEYTLTLKGVHPSVLYFADRPNREVGVMSIAQFVAGLFHKPGAASPNAAINALVPQWGSHQYTMGVTLSQPKYDRATQTIRYHASQLPQGPSSRREHGRTDVTLPKTFSHTSLFVDSGGLQCAAWVDNYANVTIPEQSWPNNAGKWSSDDWTTYPPNPGPDAGDGQGHSGDNWSYGSEGGSLRGCHNWVNFNLPDGGTMTLSLSNPWSSSRTITCDVNTPSGQFRCGWIQSTSSTSGDALNVNFVICSDNPQYQQVMTDNGGNSYTGCDWVSYENAGDGGITWLDQ